MWVVDVADESDANFVTSSRLEVILYNLERYTNYSIQVLAYTRKGEGVRSDPIYITTQQDGQCQPRPPSVSPTLCLPSLHARTHTHTHTHTPATDHGFAD